MRPAALADSAIVGAAALAEPGAPASSLAAVAPSLPTRLAGYLELTKPRIVALVLVTTLLGFAHARSGQATGWGRLLWALAGTGLVTGGANALNMYLERDTDAWMRRTRGRPLPSGLIAPGSALGFGVALSAGGTLLLAATVNLLTALLGAASAALYVLVYTPLKRRSPVSTLVGAVPGAIPPVMGWTAARGALAPEAALLFAILFFWQIPHFLAIAWLFREDYARAGFPMLSVVDPGGSSTARHAVLGVVALLAASVAPAAVGLAGALYAGVALLLGAAFLAVAARFARRLTDREARGLFLVSIVYLPLVLALLAFGAGA